MIYDEVHLLPAPVFKLTAELQARRGRLLDLPHPGLRPGHIFSVWPIMTRAYEELFGIVEAWAAKDSPRVVTYRDQLATHRLRNRSAIGPSNACR